MKSKAVKGAQKQTARESQPLERLRQLLLPMVAGISATKQHLVEWVHGVGLEALRAVLEERAEGLAGKKGGRQAERSANHWGKTRTELPFGGRRVVIERPRVMSIDDVDAAQSPGVAASGGGGGDAEGDGDEPAVTENL